MKENDDKLENLRERVEIFRKKQEDLFLEMNKLREEIFLLQNLQDKETASEKAEHENAKPQIPAETIISQDDTWQIKQSVREEIASEIPAHSISQTYHPSERKSLTEKFIGENLINKVGIIITVIGVVIGAKYTIEHQLISPLTRIIIGYLIGLALLGFGIKVKKDYKNYSAVLVSGAMAIFYFLTFAAYSFYNLIPQAAAFVLMVLFTVFTVLAAIHYSMQVIALIGLVGAYAVPFLLSNDSGRVDILFSYIAIINLGVLFIAHKRYWKSVYYSSFAVTWIIYYSWYANKYQPIEHFGLSLTFLALFFVIFYLIFLDYKLLQKEKFDAWDIILLLANSFIFYGIGYSILNTDTNGKQLLGLYTLGNAITHFGVSVLIYKQKLADRNLFYLAAGLVLTFITIAIPIQLNGSWVTLIWACEAALLFWIGRTQKVPFYEILSYVLMVLAFISIVQDWITLYNSYTPDKPENKLIPIFNMNFLTSLIFIGSFAFINYLNYSRKYVSSLISQKELTSIMGFAIPAILIIVIYYAFRMEISNYINQLYVDSSLKKSMSDLSVHDGDLLKYKIVWLINYSLLFITLLAIVNNRKIRSYNLGLISVFIIVFLMLIFLTAGLYGLSQLRESYLNQANAAYFYRGSFNIWIRYISIAFAGLMLFTLYRTINKEFIKPNSLDLKIWFDFVLYISILWVASSELINWMDIYKFQQSYKLGLSILWGGYALALIALGIWQRKKYLRIGAIVLFAFTLLKLFYYDIAYLDTISKTVVFVSLGVLLLIISFLYNKYKHLIFEENEN